MKLSLKIKSISLLIFISCAVTPLFSQNDSIKKTKKSKSTSLLDSKKELKPINLFKIEPKAKKTKINFKPKKELPKFKPNDKNYYDLFNKPKNSFNIRGGATVDSDVLVVKYFNGKKITNRQAKIKSTYSLGVFHTASKSVRIEVRDFGLEDGDRIRIYLNGEVLEESIKLKNRFYFINIPLKKGFNTIDIKALNQGYSGPNTAELEIYDETGALMTKHTWNINTGQVVSTSVVRN